jgi:hypothetical protein
MLLPWLCSTSTCRGFVTTCSAPDLFFGIFLLFSRSSSLNSPGSENAGQVNDPDLAAARKVADEAREGLVMRSSSGRRGQHEPA